MTTLNLQVGASTDDAFENAAGTTTTNGAAIGALTTGNMWAGFRFQNVAAPQAASVSVATFSPYVNSTSTDDAVFDVYGEATDNAAAFAASANNVSGRSRGTQKTAVNATAVGVGFYAIDVTAVVQEIFNRPGWASNNALALIIDALAGVNFQCRAYDGNASEAAKLDITYTTGGGLTKQVTYYAMMRGA